MARLDYSPALENWVQVAEVGQTWQGELIVGRLRQSGIEAQIVDQTFHQEPVPAVPALAVVRVFVPTAQEEEAKHLISHGLELRKDAALTSDEADDEPE
ncbi:MAG: hypothetical protein C5B57_11850 [Blastocatellia bacterium]|nr:MAG: hypothetical protein C5B57_11850 [Blastocatellia bacterium]